MSVWPSKPIDCGGDHVAPPSRLIAYWLGRSALAFRSKHQATASSRSSEIWTIFDSQNVRLLSGQHHVEICGPGSAAIRRDESRHAAALGAIALPVLPGRGGQSQRPSRNNTTGEQSSKGPGSGGLIGSGLPQCVRNRPNG